MSDRPVITTLPAGGRYSVATLNSNFQALRNKFDLILGLNGTGGDNNTMTGNINMGGSNILNAGSILDASGNDLVDLAAQAAANAVTTAADVVTTTAKVALTAADVVSTNADVVTTAAKVVLTNADVVTTNSATGALANKFTYDNSTSMGDPGTGDFRLNHGTMANVTAIAFDATSADTGNPDISDYIATWGSSTATIKGHILFRKSGTPATFAIFNVTAAVTDNTGWLQVTVTHNDSNGTFSNGDSFFVHASRSGSDGADGSGDLTAANNLSDVAAAATAATNLGLGTGSSPQFTGINLGHASNTTITREGAGDLNIEGNHIYRVGGTDVSVADGGTGGGTASAARTNLGLVIGTNVAAYDADALFADTDDTLSGGFQYTADDDGTKTSGTYTPAYAGGNIKTAVNGGAHTLAPQTGNGVIIIQYTNDGSAGSLTTSGYDKVSGDTVATTSGNDYLMQSTIIGAFSHLHVTDVS
jgi:hypothetical protein